MKKLDKFIFSKVEQIGEGPLGQKFNDFILSIDERRQKLISLLISFCMAFFPFIVLVIIFLSTSIVARDVKTLRTVLDRINIYRENRDINQRYKDQLLAASPLATEDNMSRFIATQVASLGLESGQLALNPGSFRSISMDGQISVVESSIAMANMPNSKLMIFLGKLLENKFRLQDVDLSLNADNLLSGNIVLVQLFSVGNSI
jgi:hypothetical protein